MTRPALCPTQEYLHKNETALQKRLDAQLRHFLEQHGIAIASSDEIRIAEVCFLLRWAISFEENLLQQRANPQTQEDISADEAAPPKTGRRTVKTTLPPESISPAAIESIAKLWERARKAIGELEERCTQSSGHTKTISLADALAPLLQKTTGILEETLQQ